MGQRIIVDPITRIEGHLRIEIEVEGGKVKNAWSSGQMFRGIEMILQGRDPRDAHHFVQRSCGVCTYVHSVASVRAVDDAVGVKIPKNARLIRNLLHAAQFQHDHLVHFYHLHALDWVDVISALKADPKATATLADNVSGSKVGGANYYKSVQQRLQTFVDSGQLGPFANAYWGHPAYKLTPEANLMACAHYIEALRLQAKAARMHAIFGGKNPHPQSLVVGGVTCVADLTPERIAEFLYIAKETQDFVKNVYIPDLLAVASFYKDWGGIGGCTNFLAYGEFPQNEKEPESLYMPRGVVFGRDVAKVQPVDQMKITEDVTRSWYEEGGKPLHPWAGETKPLKENPKYDTASSGGKYSWTKAPRYEGKSCEVGPLARVLVAYGKGHKDLKPLVDSTLEKLGIPVEALFSTLGRTAARGLETIAIGDQVESWVMELVENLKNGDNSTYTPYEMKDGQGVGLNDVPRGALGHWVKIKDGKIENYQYVVPSTWNLGPRDAAGNMSPVEEALIGTPIHDPKRPMEILRTVHSFDPCIACAIHVIDPDSNEVYKVRVC
ncbi:MAG TPA: nickel-dependent hydrogenase large subunit [Desulfobacteraceae bacterium]|nr:nickel-dependent hydrogenase large subunit [Deltaproteobacteria bacterium]MBW2356346.1 nickel-dependent hydrogenase large subunit [Deltaproteobacteria bacterium]RLB96547.1 MAG: hydrogenase 2 large subunit [Deltaproteobacteria bacterium]HDI60423.1 nickel-dependent hydrogenase large subunit [Desulfobacteraceae bacterium]